VIRLLLLACLGLALLAGCTTAPGAMQVRTIERSKVLVLAAGASVTVTPPDGFCVLRDTVKTSDQGVIALIGACANAKDPEADLLTASVSNGPLFRPDAPHEAELDRLEEFLGSKRGLALVGRGGTAKNLKILETHREDDALILLVEDDGEQVIPGSAPRFWRAFLEVNGRMVSLSVSSFAEGTGDERVLYAVMRRFIAGLRQANRSGTALALEG
jgi:hypothetical protein